MLDQFSEFSEFRLIRQNPVAAAVRGRSKRHRSSESRFWATFNQFGTLFGLRIQVFGYIFGYFSYIFEKQFDCIIVHFWAAF